jgi:hypothetical protein
MLKGGDVYEVVTTQTFSGSTLLNVIHVELLIDITSGAQAKFQTLADDLKDMNRVVQASSLAYTTWKAVQVSGNGVTYSATTCRRSGGDIYEGNHTGTLTGANVSGAPASSFMALVSALKTGLAGRSRRGAVYVGGLDTNSLSGSDRDYWSTTVLTTLGTAQTTFFNKYKADGGTSPDFTWVVWSKFIASGCKYVPAVPKWHYEHVQDPSHSTSAAAVTSVTPRSLVVPMRRRKEGRGI